MRPNDFIYIGYFFKMKQFGLIDETKLFHFHRIFKNGGGGEGIWADPPPHNPPSGSVNVL